MQSFFDVLFWWGNSVAWEMAAGAPACKRRIRQQPRVTMLTPRWSVQPRWPPDQHRRSHIQTSSRCDIYTVNTAWVVRSWGLNQLVSHVRSTLKARIKCANDGGDKTLTVWVIAGIMCDDISVEDRAGRGPGALSVSAKCLGGDVGMKDSSERLSVHTTSALSWVLIDMSLFQVTRFWSGMRQAEAIRISSLCVSQTSKYHLGGFPSALWSFGGTAGGWAQTTAETETLTGAVKGFPPPPRSCS